MDSNKQKPNGGNRENVGPKDNDGIDIDIDVVVAVVVVVAVDFICYDCFDNVAAPFAKLPLNQID